MISYVIYGCHYETGPPRHGPHILCIKFTLFVCQLLVFGVPLLNVNLGLGLGLITF